jgi:hypothetical protein
LSCPDRYASAEEKEMLDDADVADMIKTAPSPEEMQGMSAVYLLNGEKDVVNSDGTGTYELHVVIKILDKQAIPLGEIRIPYNSDEATLEISLARTILPDYSVVNVSKDNIKEMSPYSAFPLYSNIKLKQFAMPAMDVGNVIEYKATLKVFKPLMPGFFFTYWSFPPGLPVVLSTLQVDMPENMEEAYLMKNMDLETQKTVKDGRKIFRWEAQKVFIGGIFEPLLPPYNEACPNMVFCAKKDWEDVAKWFYSLATPQINADEKMKTYVQDVVKRKAGDREKVMKELYEFVSQKIRYVAMPLKSSSYQPHKAGEIFRDRYGDCKDKSTLLISLYSIAGIEADFALLKTRHEGQLIKDFPALDFNHCVVAVPKGEKGGYIFLDPTLELNRFGYIPTDLQDADIFVVKKDGYEFVRLPVEYEDISGTKTDIGMKIGEGYVMQVEEKNIFYGESEIDMRLSAKYSTPDATKAYMEQTLQGMYTRPRLLWYEFSNPDDLNENFTLKASYEVSDHIKEAGNLLIFDPPAATAMSLNMLVGPDERRYSIFFPTLSKYEATVTLAIPKGCRINYLPANFEKDSPFAIYWRKISSDAEKITIDYYFKTRMLEIPPSQYAEFKAFVKDVVKASKESIIFEKQNI